ncbi:MAG: hypothetical protein FVQ84_08225 [Planctomycetes bacterium]|nr:hypothetical protein [Planctomycetota bacterium]
MKISGQELCRILFSVSIFGLMLITAGCEASGEIEETVVEAPKPIFFPKPPTKARLQFLRSISREKDFVDESKNKRSGLERFVLGEEKVSKEIITKPFGVAIHDGKLYVCDVGKHLVEVLDIKGKKFSYLTKDRRLVNPANIFIEPDGTKYITDAVAGSIFVFDKDDQLKAILGRELGIKPVDIVVRGKRCYVADLASNQILVMDKTTGQELHRIGKDGTKEGFFASIAGLALDSKNNMYASDKLLGTVKKYDSNGIFQAVIGQLDDSLVGLVRPKGIAIDKEDRIWIVDTASEVVKIFDSEHQLLLIFGRGGAEPGQMLLPATITIDYDNVELFKEYFAEGAIIEYLIIVANQFGPNLISIYGFGEFPEPETTGSSDQQQSSPENGSPPETEIKDSSNEPPGSSEDSSISKEENISEEKE